MKAALFLPADRLRLLGQHQGGGHGGRRFMVARGDGEVIQLPLLPYLIMAAIAEGGVDGGWTADQVGVRVRSASGQGLTVDTVRYLIAGKLAPPGLIARPTRRTVRTGRPTRGGGPG
jgi:putative peptide zinc metalloprotease protein